MTGYSRSETGLDTARLPGIRFETVPMRRQSVLPRMDIPVFVGFASSGPLHLPVPVEDAAEFSEIFGADPVLAWDSERGRAGTAYLAATVRSFFQNGGRRCWVVRVANEFTAHTAYFPVPGLAAMDGSGLSPAFCAARSPGSWGDALKVSASLLSQSFVLEKFDPDAGSIEMTVAKPGDIIAGDVLRLDFDQDQWFCLFPISTIQKQDADPAPSLNLARKLVLTASKVWWFRPAEAQAPAVSAGDLVAYTQNGPLPALAVTVPASSWPTAPNSAAVFDYAGILDPASLAASGQGCLVKVVFTDGQVFWMLVSSQVANDTQPAIPGVGEFERFSGSGIWQALLPPDVTAFADPSPRLEKLTFELLARVANKAPQRLSGLGFAVGHPLYWNALPGDQELYTTQASLTTGDASYQDLLTNPAYLSSTSIAANGLHTALWEAAAAPRFPLAGGSPGVTFLPLLIPTLSTLATLPVEPPGDALSRDGLAAFEAGIFLDPDLADQAGDALLSLADDLRYLRTNPRPLRGIYAALSVSEATLVAVPDAVHNRWEKGLLDPIPPAQPSEPPERPVWWHFLPCSPRQSPLPRTSQPEWGEFLRCGLRIIPPPVLSVSAPDITGTFSLTWTAIADITRYILEQSFFPDFRNARPIYSGALTSCTIYGYADSDYYFRVRAEADSLVDGLVETSDYSNGVGLRIEPGTAWISFKDAVYDPTALLAVHRCLLRLSAARGDLFAVLSLAASFKKDLAINHTQNLQSPLSPLITVAIPDLDNPGTNLSVDLMPLNFNEERSLGFGAVYHPWLFTNLPASTAILPVPPDGCACGVIARRSFERGAWIAPANEKFAGVLGIQPLIDPAGWLEIQDAHINLIRDEAKGYLMLSANTLSQDPDWSLINVRRLISLLRRLAQRYGPGFVFEPNSPGFRRMVQREFSALLDQLLARGAFAGSAADTSYQVNVIASPQDIDAGRLIIELRVAPSVPLRFILVRLVQSGDQSSLSEAASSLRAAGD